MAGKQRVQAMTPHPEVSMTLAEVLEIKCVER